MSIYTLKFIWKFKHCLSTLHFLSHWCLGWDGHDPFVLQNWVFIYVRVVSTELPLQQPSFSHTVSIWLQVTKDCQLSSPSCLPTFYATHSPWDLSPQHMGNKSELQFRAHSFRYYKLTWYSDHTGHCFSRWGDLLLDTLLLSTFTAVTAQFYVWWIRNCQENHHQLCWAWKITQHSSPLSTSTIRMLTTLWKSFRLNQLKRTGVPRSFPPKGIVCILHCHPWVNQI